MKNNNIIIAIVFLVITSFFVYLNAGYKATDDVEEYLKGNESVIVKHENNGYYFDGPGDNNMLVFYPGAKVEYTSYAPLMYKIAEKGVDTFIVKMPYNLAFLNINAVSDIISSYEYDNWYIGGHSLGGVVASMDARKNDIKGLILLGSYSTKKIDCKALSIYGSNDGVLNLKKYKKNIKNLTNNKEVIIDGGNHAYFGNYGEQKGDKTSVISRIEQQDKTVEEIYNFILQ